MESPSRLPVVASPLDAAVKALVVVLVLSAILVIAVKDKQP